MSVRGAAQRSAVLQAVSCACGNYAVDVVDVVFSHTRQSTLAASQPRVPGSILWLYSHKDLNLGQVNVSRMQS